MKKKIEIDISGQIQVENYLKKEETYSSFLFLKSDQSKFSLTENSLNLVSILNISANTAPNNISVNGGELMTPSHFNMIANTANAINPQAIIPNIQLNNSLFIYLPLDLLINNPTMIPKIRAIDMLNAVLNFNTKLSNTITTTTTEAPPKIVLYSFDNINKDYLNNYINFSIGENDK